MIRVCEFSVELCVFPRGFLFRVSVGQLAGTVGNYDVWENNIMAEREIIFRFHVPLSYVVYLQLLSEFNEWINNKEWRCMVNAIAEIRQRVCELVSKNTGYTVGGMVDIYDIAN